MKRLPFMTILAILIASCSSGGGGGGPVKPLVVTPYYPLKIGSTWTYTCEGVKVVNKVVAHERIGDMECAKIESTVDGKTYTEHIGATEDGIYRCALNGIQPSSPIRLLKLPPKNGDEWKLDVKVGGEKVTGKVTVEKSVEEVKVAKGSFKPFLARSQLEWNGQGFDTQNFFVKDLGIVKIQLGLVGKGAVIELESFTPGN